MHTFWVTFYSYKGGVGRSMALANVAADLATRGRRVVMIDFDLEAPGLDAFEELGVKDGAPGLVEYVSSYLKTDIAAPVAGFIQEVAIKKAGAGKLWVMHAGRKDEEYNRLRAAINWEDLYDNRDGAAFFENFKADIQQQFQPDYVFIDSRTGLTDVGGVCTLHLPDMVVLLFSLNEQNLQGISSVARVLRNSESAPLLLPVATPVPNLPREKDGPLKERFERAKELLGVEIKHTISYSSMVALKEQIVTWTGGQRLEFEYNQLASAITDANPKGLDYLLREAESALKVLEFDRAQEICGALESEYPDRSDAWLQIAAWRRMDKNLAGTEAALRKALELSPNSLPVFRQLESLLLSQNREQEVLGLAEEMLRGAIGLDEDDRESVETVIGENCMRLGLYDKAAEAFGRILLLTKNSNEDSTEIDSIVPLYNQLEARRRAGDTVQPREWRELIKLYEASATGLAPSMVATRLNQMQAMHLAYALAGDVATAERLLREVNRHAESASPRERIFSVATYRHLPRKEFLEVNARMLEALAKGELWDGFKIQ
jgi:MinD-like ATPase involved in chromosome partitioning or flagellar assembly/tetratricopeptide (TPR) repeat protein